MASDKIRISSDLSRAALNGAQAFFRDMTPGQRAEYEAWRAEYQARRAALEKRAAAAE